MGDLLLIRARRMESEARLLDADADSLATYLYRGRSNPVILARGVSYAAQWEELVELRAQAAFERERARQERRSTWGRQSFRAVPLDVAHRGAS